MIIYYDLVSESFNHKCLKCRYVLWMCYIQREGGKKQAICRSCGWWNSVRCIEWNLLRCHDVTLVHIFSHVIAGGHSSDWEGLEVINTSLRRGLRPVRQGLISSPEYLHLHMTTGLYSTQVTWWHRPHEDLFIDRNRDHEHSEKLENTQRALC